MLLRPTTILAITVAGLLGACGGAQSPSEGTDGKPSPAEPSPGVPGPALEEPGAPQEPGVPALPEQPANPGEPEEPGEPSVPGEPEEPAEPEEPQEPAPAIALPAQLLDLSRWKLTLPVETPHAGNPDEIRQPELASFALEPYFGLTAAKDGVLFRAPVEGATTSGSGYPRAELREMTADGSDEASWSTTVGVHTLEIRQAITHLPEVKAHVVAGQIHDAEDDVIMIRLEGEHLFVEGGGDELATLDDSYALGTVFTVKIVAGEGHIRVYYDGALALDLAREVSGCYFKAGAYTQSNLAKGDAAGAYGEVVIHDLQLTHE